MCVISDSTSESSDGHMFHVYGLVCTINVSCYGHACQSAMSWAILMQYCNNGTVDCALQAVCSGDEAAIFTSQDSFTLSVEHLGQLVGSLSLARRVLAQPSKGEGLSCCIQDEELWGEGVSGKG